MPNLTSRNTTFARYWYVTIDNDVGGIDVGQVSLFINSVLNDPRGVTKFGYHFEALPPMLGETLRKNKRNWKDVFHIRIASDKSVTNECKFGFLSCAQLYLNVILLNEDRWKYGSEFCRLPLYEYRIYCVNHEVMHLLSREHATFPKDSNKTCPVMIQQTVAKGRCVECPWPQDDE